MLPSHGKLAFSHNKVPEILMSFSSGVAKCKCANTKKVDQKVDENRNVTASKNCRQQFANTFANCWCHIYTCRLEFANFSLSCEGALKMMYMWSAKKIIVHTTFSQGYINSYYNYDTIKTPWTNAKWRFDHAGSKGSQHLLVQQESKICTGHVKSLLSFVIIIIIIIIINHTSCGH